jgi:recombination protein RecA
MARVKVIDDNEKEEFTPEQKKELADIMTRGTVGSYFVDDKPTGFVTAGCQVLDSTMGFGYPLGKIVNVVGNKSTGKTLLAIELCANFHRAFPESKIYYHESEAAFDKPYAATLGMPIEAIDFVEPSKTISDVFTVEGLFKKLDEIVEGKIKAKDKSPTIYILDSLDALSDAKELTTEIDEGSYGMAKARQLSQLFRRLVHKMNEANLMFLVISQVRTKVNATAFGEKTTRAGGMALDFYASIILHLHETEKIKKTINGITRPIGVWITVKCKKNKVALPFRECEVPIHFGFGIEDVVANLNFLKGVKGSLAGLGYSPTLTEGEIADISREVRSGNKELGVKISEYTKKIWKEVDKGFMPEFKKY